MAAHRRLLNASGGTLRYDAKGNPALQESATIPAMSDKAIANRDAATQPAEWGFLATLENRAGDAGRRLGEALVHGRSLRLASVDAGVTYTAIRDWMRSDPELRSAVLAAEAVGASVFERELERRALAGADDRGSVRALELVVKARMPEYRDKTQVQMDVVHKAESAVLDIVGDWRSTTTE